VTHTNTFWCQKLPNSKQEKPSRKGSRDRVPQANAKSAGSVSFIVETIWNHHLRMWHQVTPCLVATLPQELRVGFAAEGKTKRSSCFVGI
jgi:hypothetical protein